VRESGFGPGATSRRLRSRPLCTVEPPHRSCARKTAFDPKPSSRLSDNLIGGYMVDRGDVTNTAAGPQAGHSPSAVLRLHWQGKSIIKPSQALECLVLAAFAKRLPVHFPGEAIRMIDLPNVA
jgi:hypothetical protein